MANNISQEEEKRIKEMIDDLVERAKKASKEYLKLDQETVNVSCRSRTSYGTCKNGCRRNWKRNI